MLRAYSLGIETTVSNKQIISILKERIITREDKGDREGIPHTHPIPKVIRLELFLRPQIPRGIRQQPSRIDAEQNGGRRGERYCYSFCRRKRLKRDFY